MHRLYIYGNYQDSLDVLITGQLDEVHFKVDFVVYDRKELSPDIDDQLKTWSKGEDIPFPKPVVSLERSLNEETLLPDDLKTLQPGVVRKIQNDWSYIILTNKLWQSYLEELEDLKEECAEITEYSKELFDKSKSFWDRVLAHRKERDISQSKLDEIKADINGIFDKLKKLRTHKSKETHEQSEANRASILPKIEAAIKTISEKKDLKGLFGQLKLLRIEISDAALRKEHRKELHTELDKGFDLLNQTRSAKGQERLHSRIKGLTEVKERMEKSLERDQKELDYQKRRLDNSGLNKLELQLREAKFKMLEERIQGKTDKLKGIAETMKSLEKKLQEIQKGS